MNRIKVGITGQAGFIGYHLFQLLRQKPDLIGLIPFEDEYFSRNGTISGFVAGCDTIVHLAAMNRGEDSELYNTNIRLVQTLISALKKSPGKNI